MRESLFCPCASCFTAVFGFGWPGTLTFHFILPLKLFLSLYVFLSEWLCLLFHRSSEKWRVLFSMYRAHIDRLAGRLLFYDSEFPEVPVPRHRSKSFGFSRDLISGNNCMFSITWINTVLFSVLHACPLKMVEQFQFIPRMRSPCSLGVSVPCRVPYVLVNIILEPYVCT